MTSQAPVVRASILRRNPDRFPEFECMMSGLAAAHQGLAKLGQSSARILALGQREDSVRCAEG